MAIACFLRFDAERVGCEMGALGQLELTGRLALALWLSRWQQTFIGRVPVFDFAR
jgi:hypothetical protein